MLEKVLLSIFTFLLLVSTYLLPLAKTVNAQEPNPWYDQSYQEWLIKVYDTEVSPPDEIFGERYTAAQVNWVIYSVIQNTIGRFIPRRVQVCIAEGNLGPECAAAYIDVLTYESPNQDRGVLATIFNPRRSMSGVGYIGQKLTKLHIIPEAQAQGFGFGALSPIQQIWTVTRNIAYAFSIVVVLIFAFMIMFRVKLNPQTVVTVQSALPKVIIALILATFSYAIAGFLIDLTYVAIGLVSYMFMQTGIFEGATWGQIFDSITSGPGGRGAIGWFALLGYYYWTGVASFSAQATGLLADWNLGISSSVIESISWVLMVVLTLWGIIAMFKIMFMLIKTYLTVILMTIIGPLQIMLGSISSGGGFMGWIKTLAGNLAVYPVVGAMFLLVVLFLAAASTGSSSGLSQIFPGGGVTIRSPLGEAESYWYPPLTFGGQDDTSTYDPLPFLWTIASVGLLSVIPAAGQLIAGITSGRGVDAGAALGAGIAGIAGAPGQMKQVVSSPFTAVGGVAGPLARGTRSLSDPWARSRFGITSWRSRRAEQSLGNTVAAREASGVPVGPSMGEIKQGRKVEKYKKGGY